jgi:hypothetical protein
MVSAIVGVYSIPILGRMKPVRRRTSMTCVIVNCSTILLLSSALPVLARTLGKSYDSVEFKFPIFRHYVFRFTTGVAHNLDLKHFSGSTI